MAGAAAAAMAVAHAQRSFMGGVGGGVSGGVGVGAVGGNDRQQQAQLQHTSGTSQPQPTHTHTHPRTPIHTPTPDDLQTAFTILTHPHRASPAGLEPLTHCISDLGIIEKEDLREVDAGVLVKMGSWLSLVGRRRFLRAMGLRVDEETDDRDTFADDEYA